jgi:hypothetical protein
VAGGGQPVHGVAGEATGYEDTRHGGSLAGIAFDSLKNFLNVDIKDGVPGKGVVQASSQPPDAASSYNVSMWLDVYVDGWEPYRVKHQCMVRAGKHPWPGTTLPVEVDRENHERLRVLWDEILTVDQQMATGAPGEATSVDAQAMPVMDLRRNPEVRAKVLAMLKSKGVDVSAAERGEHMPMSFTGPQAAEIQQEIFKIMQTETGGEGPAAALPADPGAATDDTLERLEKLGKLRTEGVLTEGEFEAQKAKILGNG